MVQKGLYLHFFRPRVDCVRSYEVCRRTVFDLTKYAEGVYSFRPFRLFVVRLTVRPSLRLSGRDSIR